MRFFAITMFCAALAVAQPATMTVGEFDQQVRTAYSTDDGLPSNDVRAIAMGADGVVYAGTAEGLAYFENGRWNATGDAGDEAVSVLARGTQGVLAVANGGIIEFVGGKAAATGDATNRYPSRVTELALDGDRLLVGTDSGLGIIANDEVGELALGSGPSRNHIWAIAAGGDRSVYVAGSEGLFVEDGNAWQRVFPSAGDRSWAPADVRGAAYAEDGSLWFASPQGAGRYDGEWTLYTGADGLPYNDFTCMAAGDGDVWFGTTKGAIRFDGATWEYRQGKRWLPNDAVRAIEIDDAGGAWIATAGGVSHIAKTPMTLAQKAEHYQYEIEHYIKRTPYGYTAEASVATPGDPSDVRNHDSDNDGLWTAMYGAGECFAYGATKSPESKKRAQQAFEALEFLGKVTRGGSHEPPAGYVARTILPTSGPNPNDGRLQRDIEEQKGEYLWKVYEPRWPTSADGQWYWKSDTSSDELDGHYFFYPLYYDLVADTADEKARVRAHIQALTDHLVEHDFQLIDHDGKPTRWGHFGPDELNHDKNWYVERGLNSLSMLSYLTVTAHITGDDKYLQVKRKLIDEHGYAQNVMVPKIQRGIGTGNQSDDEMAFMCFYNIIKYETDPELKSRWSVAFYNYWTLELPEVNPFFNFCFPAVAEGVTYTDPWGTYELAPGDTWLEDAVESLKRFPLDRYNWAHMNNDRIDIVPMPGWTQAADENPPFNRGYRVNGKALPVDERHFNHWNTDPYDLNYGGDGRGLASGAVFTLPYYMGLYHGFIEEK